jgi:hypothetical protein
MAAITVRVSYNEKILKAFISLIMFSYSGTDLGRYFL